MRHSPMLGIAATAALALLAGCGSSKTTTASSSSASSSTPSTAASSSSGSPYGSNTASNAANSGSGVLVSTKHDKLGTVLAAGPKKLTVYLFEADKGASSACSGACASAWPPVTTSGAPSSAGSATAADLGTIARADGTKQVTYKGHPLYYFVKDKDSGDAYGQGSTAFGSSWYVLAPSGSKIDSGGGKS